MASWMVSRSRISPTMITSGSSRSAPRTSKRCCTNWLAASPPATPLTLTAATGIADLEIAVNSLDAQLTAAGDIALADLDGALEKSSGLTVDRVWVPLTTGAGAATSIANVVDLSAESTGVAVSRLLTELGQPIDRSIAECLYTTIVFDTGRFMHSNTTAHTFRWTAKLLETGIDAAAINRALSYTKKPHDLLIQKMGIENLQVDTQEPRLAGIVLSAAAIAAVGEPEDWGDLVEIPRSLAGNQVAYLLRESKDRKTVRCSMRSNPPFEVGPVAQSFGGGGHRQAAGCTFQGDLAAAQREILPQLRRQLQ